ncbi:hypothetical protein [Elongatibacter sediminis]|uniref:Uncharacterized protein n=1 Tax=Elongatibacter sediminis TaxID=3119006 RepID=A0AAW9R7C2_9GAMM
MAQLSTRDVWLRVVSVFAIGFGLLTLKEGGSVLFIDGPARAAAGNYVPFVLWFNFLAGFAYVIAGAGLWMRRHWGFLWATVIAAATALTFAAFGLHVASGGAFEQRTVIAMSLRTVVWIIIAVISWRQLGKALPNLEPVR